MVEFCIYTMIDGDFVFAFLLSMELCIELSIIALIVAVAAFITAKKIPGKYAQIIEYAVLPIIPLFALLFGEDDSYEIRIQIVAYLLICYVVFSILIRFIFFVYGLSHRNIGKDNSASHAQELVVVTLPLEYEFALDSKFADSIPSFTESLIHVDEVIKDLAERFVSEFNSLQVDTEKEVALRTFFLGVCYNLSSLFSYDTRVHVRILNDGYYKKYVATYEHNREYKRNLTAMSLNNKMIYQSYRKSCSLIKTFNPTLHEDGSNRKWKNYLTFTLSQFVHESRPVFSFGISVTKKKDEMLYFLNFCGIESIIGHHIDYIIENTDLQKFVDNTYFSSS